MINYKNDELNNWNKMFDGNNCEQDSQLNAMIIQTDQDRSIRSPQNIKLQIQVNGEDEDKYLLSNKTNHLTVNSMINHPSDNSLKINHDNGLSQSCLSLNQFDLLPSSSTQLSLDSLSSDNCIHAEAGRLFHQQLDKELSKVIPLNQSSQRRKSSVETVQNRYKFNRKRKKNSGKFN